MARRVSTVKNPGASSGSLQYEKTEIERSKLRGIQPGRQNLIRQSKAMKIGIIGAGNVGGALGTSWVKAGHQVKFGVREPGDPKHRALLDACGENATAGTTAEAAAFGEVLALATPWDATQAALSGCGSIKDKVLVDCTNPLKFTQSRPSRAAARGVTKHGEIRKISPRLRSNSTVAQKTGHNLLLGLRQNAVLCSTLLREN